MNQVLEIINKILEARATRYSGFILCGVLIGMYVGQYYPEVNAKFWGQPIIALVLGLFAIAQGSKARKNWEGKVADALAQEPPKPEARP